MPDVTSGSFLAALSRNGNEKRSQRGYCVQLFLWDLPGPSANGFMMRNLALNLADGVWALSFLSVGGSEAPASRLKRFAAAAMKETGNSLVNKVLEQAANTACIKNAERDLLDLFKKQGLMANLAITTLTLGPKGQQVPCVQLHTWMEYLLRKRPEYLLGGFHPGQEAKMLLETYWQNISECMPDHDGMLACKDKWCSSIPFYIHLDEGVGQRKRAVLVINFQTVFGPETAVRYREGYQYSDHSIGDAGARECMTRAQFHNSKNSTLQSRFLFSALSKRMYTKENEKVYDEILSHLADECIQLLASGINVGGTTWYGVCMGLKGDAPALKKAANFNRSFANLGRNKGICPECLAGLCDIPFEDCGKQAVWRMTVAMDRPWVRAGHLSRIATRSYKPEAFYRRDPFHVFKQSLAGHFLASAVVVVAEMGMFTLPGQSTAVAELLNQACDDFTWYVKHDFRGRSVNHIKSFTKEIFHFPRLDSFPAARFKGSDALLMLRWLRQLMLAGPVRADGVSRTGVSPATSGGDAFGRRVCSSILAAANSGLQFFHVMHTEGLWIGQNAAGKMVKDCETFCKEECSLAREFLQLGKCRFRMEPCVHHFMHFGVDLQEMISAGASWIYSPVADNCEGDEDFVGRVCRLSRCVHMSSMSLRTLQRYLIRLEFEMNLELMN